MTGSVAARRGPKPRAGLPKCPTHIGSRVKRAGLYGKNHDRQRYRCTPTLSKAKSHIFSGLLPRRPSPTGTCEECEREYHGHDGPPAARQYAYSVRDIAWALIQVGNGVSYRSVARRLRRRHHRHPKAGTIINGPSGIGSLADHSRDARLIGDWIESYAPAILRELSPSATPTTVLADHLVFRISTLNQKGQPKSGGKDAFFVLGIAGQSSGQRATMLHLEAAPTRTVADWVAAFKKVKGTPSRLVCDGEAGIVSAGQKLWPGIQVTISPWHLQHRAYEYLRDAKRHGKDDLLCQALDAAFKSAIFWDAFAVLAGRAKAVGTQEQKAAISGLKSWVVRNGPTVKAQFKQKGWPVSTGALENQLRTVKGMLFDRRDAFTNRARTTLALGLMRLHLNELDEQRDYQRIIREELEANGGRPVVRRGRICDKRGTTSLRK